MKKNSILSSLVGLCITMSSLGQSPKQDYVEITNIEYNEALLVKIRKAAHEIPGKKANELRYVKFAESPRTFEQTVEGGTKEPYIQARTAYQLCFDKQWIMIDAGMDQEVHEFFGKGQAQPFFSKENDNIQLALKGAKQIIITHEHGDHIAGVLRTEYYEELAPKTMLTKQMVNTLLFKPQTPLLQLKKEQLKDFLIVDFQDILPVSPGVVLIKAPGHTPGEIMVYIQFENGKEYLITGDVSWSYAGIEEKKQKPVDQVKRIGEDATLIRFQLDWLNQLPAKGIQLIVNHDDIIQPELVKKGMLKSGLLLHNTNE